MKDLIFYDKYRILKKPSFAVFVEINSPSLIFSVYNSTLKCKSTRKEIRNVRSAVPVIWKFEFEIYRTDEFGIISTVGVGNIFMIADDQATRNRGDNEGLLHGEIRSRFV